MAKLYGEIASKALLTLDKSFARANGQPLDASEVYYSLAAAQEYAAGAQAYIGQKIVVIEDGVVTHYSVNDTNGTLKELGAKPIGDGTTISIAPNGTISLANISDKAEGTYNAVLVNGQLTWVKPSETTVEGLNDLLQALTGRVDGHDTAIANNAQAIIDEAAAARAAEAALGKRIDEIDFVDEEELASAITEARKSISTEIDEDVKVAKDRADEAYELAETKVDAEAYAADKKALQDEDAAIREIAEAAKERIDTFLDEEGVADVVDSLHDLKAELDKMADATEMVEALAAKADVTYVNEELAKKQDVIPENTYDAYGAAAAAEGAAKAHADSVAATAKSEAIEAAASDATSKANQALVDAKADAAGLYATKAYVGEFTTGEDAYKDLDTVVAYINKKAEETLRAAQGGSSETAASVALALQNYKTENDPKVSANAENIATINEKLKDIEAGADVNIIESVKVNGTALTPDANKAVNVVVPTKFSEITDDSGFGGRLESVENAVVTAQSTAESAGAAAAKAQGEVDSLESEVGEMQTVVSGHTDTIGKHAERIGALEQADIAHATEYSTLNGIVSGHTEAIAKKADLTALNEAVGKIGENTAAITSLGTEVEKKANASELNNYHTKSEIAGITGTVADGKTLVQMISEAQAAATYNDTEVRGLIFSEASRADTEEKRLAGLIANNADDIVAINALLNTVSSEDNITSLKELAVWVEEHGAEASEMADAIDSNAKAIAAINHADTGILAVAKGYTDAAIAGIPVATAEALGLVKFDDVTVKMNENKQLYVAKVSTDILEQGTQILVLNGGSALQ